MSESKKARTKYKVLFEKYYRAYSYGQYTFQQFMKAIRSLNRCSQSLFMMLCIVLLLSSCAYARDINTIIIHHTGETNIDISAEQIARYHINERGWKDIGYHYVIRRNGDIELGRPIELQGAHAKKGGRNVDSIGIALSGFTATQKQLESLELLLRGLPIVKSIERHHEECPGESVPVEKYNKQFCN